MPNDEHRTASGTSLLRGRLVLSGDRSGPTIHRDIHGHFAEHLGRCIYEGIWVGEDSTIPHIRGIRRDVVEALRKLSIPVLRWPGGCFADEYHWRDGVGPRAERPKMINTHWGGVVENNHFGTHEFMDLCEQIGAKPYVCGNVGSGSVQEMMEWVEYMTSDADSPMANWRRRNGRQDPWKLAYFGVGNESWGCGGNMRPEFYADNFRRYNTFVKNYAGHRIRRIACGANGSDFGWTEILMREAGPQMDGLSLHWYTLPTGDWKNKGSSTEFDEAQWHSTLAAALRMDELIAGHAARMDELDPAKKVGMVVDEWGAWYDPEPGTNPAFLHQQNTIRDALVAAINLNIFHRHCERVTMANIAQMVNVLQSVILTDRERMIVTPTYHVFEMYRVHKDATLIACELQTPEYELAGKAIPMIHASASRDSSGMVHVSLVNLHARGAARVDVTLPEGPVSGRVLTGSKMNARNTFDAPDAVAPAPFDGFVRDGDVLAVTLPPRSVIVLRIG